MSKPLTKRQIDIQVRKTIEPLRKALEPDRPSELRPEIEWGITWEIELNGLKQPSAIILIVSAVRRELLLSRRDENKVDSFNPLAPKARKALEAYCDLITAQTNVIARYTWTLGCRDNSEGNLIGLTS